MHGGGLFVQRGERYGSKGVREYGGVGEAKKNRLTRRQGDTGTNALHRSIGAWEQVSKYVGIYVCR